MDPVVVMLQRLESGVDKLAEISQENSIAIARLEAGVEKHQEMLSQYEKQAGIKHEALVAQVAVIKKDVEHHSFIVRFSAVAIAIILGGLKLLG